MSEILDCIGDIMNIMNNEEVICIYMAVGTGGGGWRGGGGQYFANPKNQEYKNNGISISV